MKDGVIVGKLLWIFTLGSPPDEMMRMLWGWTMSGGIDWLVVQVPEEPGQEGFLYHPDDEAPAIGVK